MVLGQLYVGKVSGKGLMYREKTPLKKASFMLKMKSLKNDKTALADIILYFFFCRE